MSIRLLMAVSTYKKQTKTPKYFIVLCLFFPKGPKWPYFKLVQSVLATVLPQSKLAGAEHMDPVSLPPGR